MSQTKQNALTNELLFQRAVGAAFDGISPVEELTPTSQIEWMRLAQSLPLAEGPRLLCVLVDPPLLRRRLAEHLTAILADGSRFVAPLDWRIPFPQPLQEIFEASAQHSAANFLFLFG